MFTRKLKEISERAKGSFDVQILADSENLKGKRITTFKLVYPRWIHGEILTHRVFSRCSSSSRAVPVKKVISQVWNKPALFVEWGSNNPGMQSKSLLSDFKTILAYYTWIAASKFACVFAYVLMKIGCHKQIVNRCLEPWQFMHTVLTATELDNFFALRTDKDAQPEFQYLAKLMYGYLSLSIPNVLQYGEWHLPFVSRDEEACLLIDDQIKISVARCARTSYKTFDGKTSTIDDDLKLYDKLVGAQPIHASAAEHSAQAVYSLLPHQKSNLVGWLQYRKLIPGENIKKFTIS